MTNGCSLNSISRDFRGTATLGPSGDGHQYRDNQSDLTFTRCHECQDGTYHVDNSTNVPPVSAQRFEKRRVVGRRLPAIKCELGGTILYTQIVQISSFQKASSSKSLYYAVLLNFNG